MSWRGDTTYDYMNTDYWERSTSFRIRNPPDKSGLVLGYDFGNIEKYPWEPGDLVQFTITVTKDGEKVKPDGFAIEATDWSNDVETDVPYNNPEDGINEVEYKVPSSLRSDATIDIEAGTSSDDEEASMELTIPVFKYYVWFHQKFMNTTLCQFGT
jgi:hypothetical protein